jgi:hypothetical protein
MTMQPLRPEDDDLLLEPVQDSSLGEPVVSDVNGRLWRIRRHPRQTITDFCVAVVVLMIIAAIAVALIV